MIISQLTQTKDNTYTQISARVQFEASNHPEKTIFIKTPPCHRGQAVFNPPRLSGGLPHPCHAF